jgi:hypothetical protein
MVFWLISMTFTNVWPLYVLALVVLAGVTWQRRRAAVAGPHAPVRLLLAALVAPALLPLWAAATFGAEKGARSGALGWASGVLTVLALAVVGFAGWAVWRWRSNWLAAMPCALAIVVTTALGWFIGAMAIADDWI